MRNRLLTIIIVIVLGGLTFYYLEDIVNYTTKLIDKTPTIVVPNKNKYAKEEKYKYIQTTNNFTPYNYQELLNIFYTILDSGYEKFTFYCPSEYEDCLDDVSNISNTNNSLELTTLGNYLSPFNNFSHLKIEYDPAGEVTVIVTKLYTEDEIDKVNEKIDLIWKDIVKDDMNTNDIIYAFHDYIINTTKYDQLYESELKTGITTHNSSKAIGPLYEGYGICSGYTDLMAIILDRLHIKNFKVASNTHVWNALYIDGKWKHLDLTWDDPVGVDNNDNLIHKFYLIDTESLEKFDIEDHTFDKTLYLELY